MLRLRTLGFLLLAGLIALGLIQLNTTKQGLFNSAFLAKPVKPSPARPRGSEIDIPISALGYLSPSGEIRKLAPPAQRTDGVPVLEMLYVEEGQRVRRNQVLATFDSLKRIDSEIATFDTRISSLRGQIEILERETQRYRSLAAKGAFPSAELESREFTLLRLKSELKQTTSERKQAEVEKSYSQLRSPINGIVLKILTREGERPSPQGVMEVGASQQMEAIAQVSEDNISSIKIGQIASIVSENQGFSQKLEGRVIRIAPSVRKRLQLSLDPRADSDLEARTVEVRMTLSRHNLGRIRDLAGAKIRVTFQP